MKQFRLYYWNGYQMVKCYTNKLFHHNTIGEAVNQAYNFLNRNPSVKRIFVVNYGLKGVGKNSEIYAIVENNDHIIL